MPDQSPYMLAPDDLADNLDGAVDAVFGTLSSQFMLLPKGDTYLTYPEFQAGFEALRIASGGFRDFTTQTCWDAVRRNARAWIVLRAIIGVSPPEWGDLANELNIEPIPTNWCREVDGDAKRDPDFFNTGKGQTGLRVRRIDACFAVAVGAISGGAGPVPDDVIHRLSKFDTRDGIGSVQHAAEFHVPYAVLLYERFLGRPFASHRDAISELVGDVMELAIEAALASAHIPFRKTKRAERVPGFEQAPDFFAPDELAPISIIEAKVCGDDGTARDKVSRVLRLAAMRDERLRTGRPSFEVIACIDGRGFRVRRQDMRDLITATRGKVFTMATLPDLIDNTSLKQLKP